MNRTILIADDHADLRKLIRMTLLGGPFTVLEAEDGVQALADARARRPDLIILDVMMPGELDGYQVCAAVKADPALRDVPVILVTARAQRADLQAGQEAGADAYLIKPFSPMELLERVTAMLGN
ncbi:response regulator [Deinococcus sp. 14RED07]|uniref:response regulator transcription factor n=1 Tax=unclassified Deinococcus TaxID=2623546 RepID=UPI001E5AAD5F|nr:MULTISPECIES: response regulator [unclassified Deinococcus]MCD0161336.1 response regulator [Deinococcus sp. 6YEL10]MCD0176059.1 response regulator [Deinococcus sp. 14RED07]